MTPVRCIGDDDCWRACIASVLDRPARDVPNFAKLAGDDWNRMYELAREWLRQHKLGIFRTYCSAGWELKRLLEIFSGENPGIPIIVAGQSGTSAQEAHAVVAMDGQIIHDPSGAGVAGPWACGCDDPNCKLGYWWLDVIVQIA